MSLLERYTQPAESQIPTVSHEGEIPSGQPTCTIWIDGKEVTAIPGEAILRAAQRAGFEVPTLCDDEKLAPAAACRMCLVEIEGYHRPMPSCHLPVEPGMKITQASDSLFKLRRQNLEYILSDHNAYCMPPCQVSCPTHIDIPGYLELMSKGQHVEAARLVKEVLPFPYMLGLVCPKPCQEVCRRGLVEEEIAICQCHGYTGELVMEMEQAPTPFPQLPATGKRVAVVGAGPAGMTAAYYAALKGHAVTVFDMMEKQGGIARYGIPEYRLPKVKLDKELNSVWQLRDTEFKAGVIVLCNKDGAQPAPIAQKALESLLAVRFVVAPSPSAPGNAEIGKYTGRYINGPNSVEIAASEGKLTAKLANSTHALDPVSANCFKGGQTTVCFTDGFAHVGGRAYSKQP